MSLDGWQIGNDTPAWLGRHIYFAHRRNGNGEKEYVNRPSGRLRTWRTFKAAERFLRSMAQEAA